MSHELPPPTEFGDLFPPKFTDWRGDQPRAIISTMESDKRFVGQAAPTGFGKSLMYIGVAQLTGWRVCILTSTKGLQEQLLKDFNGDGIQRLVDIRGQNAYRCVAAMEFDFPEYTTCDYAPCHAGRKCSKRDGGCLYYDQRRLASAAQVVITNYSFWLSVNKYGEGLGDFDLIVLDEAHDAPDILAEFMSVEIEPAELTPLQIKMMDAGTDVRGWKEWAKYNYQKVGSRIEVLNGIIRSGNVTPQVTREVSQLKRLLGKLEALATEMEDDWIIEKVEKNKRGDWAMKFDPIWPYKSAEKYLFNGISHVMLVSATLRDKTAKLLGIPEEDWVLYEYDSTFHKSRRPIIHVPTVQMNHRTPPENIGLWLQRIDQIIRTRQDRKGIIHTVSFARAKMILDNSDYRSRMLLNDSKNTKFTVERFKSSSKPLILVSPSVTTGYDFPYSECEYQIIGKLPFPDNRAKVIKARMENDKEFSQYMTMQILIQMCGRGMRAEDDQCETLIVDDSVTWFIKNYKKFAPSWFLDAIVWARGIPTPPPALTGKW